MTKHVYEREEKRYYHFTYCDCCFKFIPNGEIDRQENAFEYNIFDLCYDCKCKWKMYSCCGEEEHNE